MMFHNKDVGTWPCQGKGGTQFWMMSISGGFYNLSIYREDFLDFLGELKRDDTCLEFTGKGVRLKNMRCSSVGTNQVERDSVKHQMLGNELIRKGYLQFFLLCFP